MAQMDVVAGQPEKNADKLITCIVQAQRGGANMLVASEMCIPGYIMGDVWEKPNFIHRCEQANQKVIDFASKSGVCVIFGSVKTGAAPTVNEDGRARKYNACFVVDGNETYHRFKTLMPNYREFDDSRHFYDTRKVLLTSAALGNFEASMDSLYSPFTIRGIKFGCILCEDGWSTDYTFDVINEYVQRGAEAIINISCSPYTFRKNNKRNRVFGGQAKEHGIPIIYVNNVGCQNNCKSVFTFDGNSCMYDKTGAQLNPYKPFEEACHTFHVDLDAEFGKKDYSDSEDVGDLYHAIRYGTKKMLELSGIENVVIGASGGIDSCLAAAIYADIIPKEKMWLINIPYKYNSQTTIGIAKELAKSIGCNYLSIPIGEQVESMRKSMESAGHPMTKFNMQNVQARARLQVLAAFTSSLPKAVFTCNSNKSEATVGYCTFYGDLTGYLANLMDLWKGDIYSMSRWYNDNIHRIIPEGAFTVMPSAELDEDQAVDEGKGDPLNYPYHDQLFKAWVERWERATSDDCIKWYLDGSLPAKIGYAGVYELFPTLEAFSSDVYRWWNLFVGRSVAKRTQSPPCLCVKRRGFGSDLRESLGVGT